MIPVCWFEGIAGLDKYSAQFANEGIQGRSRYACCGLLNDAFDSYGSLFQHYSGWDGMPRPIANFAVVIIHGGHLRHLVEQINEKIAELQGVLLIGIGDEENDFPYHELRHGNMKLWMQSPVPGKSRADRFPIVGYPVDLHEHIHPGTCCAPSYLRPLDWFFAGQVTHVRREECVAQLRQMTGGKLLETKQFYSGMSHDEYFRTLTQAKIIPCPSGPVNADTFRMAEALEAGCIPIVDQHPGWRERPTTGIFNMLFPQGFPFPCVDSWSQLPQIMRRLLDDYENQSRLVREWWASYKASYYSWLGQDLKSLGVML